MKLPFICIFCFMWPCLMAAQSPADTGFLYGNNIITLSTVVVNNKLNVPAFINRIRLDTSFYKAFRNLHILNFSAINDIRMNNVDGKARATLYSRSRQTRAKGCRSMLNLEELVTGDMYDKDHHFNYYTAQMYASLFFTYGTVCGENNIVNNTTFSTAGKTGLAKHQEQLKMLFFNPGKKINGIPFMKNQTAIFDDDMLGKYDISIDMDQYNNTSCYIIKQKVKQEFKGEVVLDEMTTWFDDATFEVMARNYSLSYNTGVYDFNVLMEVQMTIVGGLTVPTLIRYTGNWKALFKKRERGIFTATLFDYSAEK